MNLRLVRTQLTFFDARDRTWQTYYGATDEDSADDVSYWAVHRKRTNRLLQGVHQSFGGEDPPESQLNAARIRRSLTSQRLAASSVRTLTEYHRDRLATRRLDEDTRRVIEQFLTAISTRGNARLSHGQILDLVSILAIPLHWDIPGCFALKSLRRRQSKYVVEASKCSQAGMIFAYVLHIRKDHKVRKSVLGYEVTIDYASTTKKDERFNHGQADGTYYTLHSPVDYFEFCHKPTKEELDHYRFYASLIDNINPVLAAKKERDPVYVINYPVIVSGFRHHLEFYVQPTTGAMSAKDILREWTQDFHKVFGSLTIIKECFRELILGVQAAAFRARALDGSTEYASAEALFGAQCNQLFHMDGVWLKTPRPNDAVRWKYARRTQPPFGISEWSACAAKVFPQSDRKDCVTLDNLLIKLLYEKDHESAEHLKGLFQATSEDQLERHLEWTRAVKSLVAS